MNIANEDDMSWHLIWLDQGTIPTKYVQYARVGIESPLRASCLQTKMDSLSQNSQWDNYDTYRVMRDWFSQTVGM